MQLINTRQSYGWLSIALHWLAAIAVIVMLWTGFNIDAAAEAGDRVLKRALTVQHMSLGITFILLLAARVFASYAQPRPVAPEQTTPLKILTISTHQLLLFAILLQIATGPLITLTVGRPIEVWNWFTIPSPFTPNHDLHEALETVHGATRWPIVVLITLHALGALKHAMLDRDGVMQRMLIAGRTL